MRTWGVGEEIEGRCMGRSVDDDDDDDDEEDEEKEKEEEEDER